ncbi:16S rRNA (cytosine(1402)-N(4))-methyltransferase RsmH [Myxococcota bacterium]|nr:16S rRNA (cytosine(1402)-N(4))-methyltransferase RsmH [Myxococcota bacterium]
MLSTFAHRPALLQESLAHLALQRGATVVDGTLGGGGHAEAILKATGPTGRLVGFDLDPEALDAARKHLVEFGDRVVFVHGSFRELGNVLESQGISRVDGVLFDLGVSSWQLDSPERGFRFSGPAPELVPLDMRMDPAAPRTAADLLRDASRDELVGWFQNHADLPGSKRLAREIVESRRARPLRTSADLIEAIDRAGIGRGRRHHPATLVFQALRMAVNDELGAIRNGIEQAIQALRPEGRMVVLAYHSAEDRVVKNAFRDAVRGCVCPPRTPVCICGRQPCLRLVTRKPITPHADEVISNPRARSARLRAAARIPETT